MDQRPSWEAGRFSASQEIPRNLWNPKVHYRIQKLPPPVTILSHIGPAEFKISHTKYFLWLIFKSNGKSKCLKLIVDSSTHNLTVRYASFNRRSLHGILVFLMW